MKKFFQNYGRFLLIFLFIFFCYEFVCYSNMYGDPIANYGFSYAIKNGEIPYLDFNTISTPLYAFLMSIGLFLFDNFLMFVIEQAILVTIMFYFLYSLYGKKSYIVLFIVVLFAFYGINPIYNYMALFFLIMLLYLEKKYSRKDFLIGIVIGLAFLSKHTIGGLFILPTIVFYYKDIKILMKRLLGFFLPIVIFCLYLIIFGAFHSFIDLCFLGLFDFTSKNGNMFNFYFFCSLICFVISLVITFKKRKDISNYYLLMGFSFVIPLFDLCHFSYYAICLAIQCLPYLKKHEEYLGSLSIILIIVYSCLLGINFYFTVHPIFSRKIEKFQYTLALKDSYMSTLKFYEIVESYDDPLILSYIKMQYDITHDRDIDYFDVLLYGNYGYNGSQKMIDRIKKMHNRYVIVDMEAYNNADNVGNQLDVTIIDYVLNHAKFVKSEGFVDIYYLE